VGKLVGAVALACLALTVCVAVLAAVIVGGAVAPSGVTSSGVATPRADRTPALPDGWVAMDQGAAATCPGLPWSVLVFNRLLARTHPSQW